MGLTKEKQQLISDIGSVLGMNNLNKDDEYLRVLSKLNLHYHKEKVDLDLDTEASKIFENIQLQKYDIVKYKDGRFSHYHVVVKIDYELNLAWTISITSDLLVPNIIPIKNSRLFNTFFVSELNSFALDKNLLKFCGIFDNKKEIDNALRIIKRYYKHNF